MPAHRRLAGLTLVITFSTLSAAQISIAADPDAGKQTEEALKKPNVKVERREREGVTHEFFGTAAVVEKAREAQAYAGQRLQQAFAAP